MPSLKQAKRQTTFFATNPLLDATNLRLLKLLSSNPRSSVKALAAEIGMSGPAVAERVQRLHDANIITGQRLEIDPRQLGLHVTAYVRVRPMPGALPDVAALAQATPKWWNATA